MLFDSKHIQQPFFRAKLFIILKNSLRNKTQNVLEFFFTLND
jgi:hypothetical protein